MFRLLKIFISAGLAVLLILVVLYFLPTNIKLKGLQAVTGVVPEDIKDEVENFVLTPPEKRDKILRELQASLDKIEKIDSSDKTPGEVLGAIKEEISASRRFTTKLKDINNDASVTNIITSKLVEKFINSGEENDAKKPSDSTCDCKLED